MIQERKAEWKLRGKTVQRRENIEKNDKSTVKVVWKNVRKIRMREKQIELVVWMMKNECDVFAMNEIGLNGN